MATAPDGTLAAHLAGVPVHRRNTHERGDLAPVKLAKFREVRNQHRHAGLANAWHGSECGNQFRVMPLKMRGDCGVVVGKFFFQEGQYPVDACTRRGV